MHEVADACFEGLAAFKLLAAIKTSHTVNFLWRLPICIFLLSIKAMSGCYEFKTLVACFLKSSEKLLPTLKKEKEPL
jgi:hypothetical protein